MLPDSAPSIVFGTGMMFHNLVAGGLPGVALALFISTFYTNSTEKKFRIFLLHLYAIHFVISSVSGLMLETGLDIHWPGLENSLVQLVNHPFGRSALLAFIQISVLLIVLLGKSETRIWKVATLYICLNSFFLSGWSVIVNSWMHAPSLGIYGNHNQDITDLGFKQVCDFMMQPFVLSRLLHHYLASILIGLFWVLFSLSLNHSSNSNSACLLQTRFRKSILGLSAILLLIQPILGHLSFNQLAILQPIKVSAIEGLYSKTTGDIPIYFFGKTNPERMVTEGIALPKSISNALQQSMDVPIESLSSQPKDKWPPVRRVFYSFRIMIVSWGALLVATCVLVFIDFSENQRTFVTSLALAIAISASSAGWMVSESGRLPWIIYDVTTVSQAVSIDVKPYDYYRAIFSNVILHLALLISSIRIQLKIVRLHFATP
ncbi:MAG: cytochrome ubiquinol oxidase subunit I [Flavobacteriales bacterium]|nr:cytochrome ubiquinol oxidase subunit I [Flavobacteriales bacterium]